MNSKFNTLYHGQPDDVLELLEGDISELPQDYLRLVLANAMRRIDRLERRPINGDPP